MNWDDLLENAVPIIFVMIWLLSSVVRVLFRGRKGKSGTPAKRVQSRSRRLVIVSLALMVIATAAFVFSQSLAGGDARTIRLVALVIGVVAMLLIVVGGLMRPRSPVQGDIGLESVERRSGEIRAGEPLEPR